ncbi:MAG: hypothetical protein NC918_00775 [Candidatus Omnitrophica bacterium]|nr:hypothetical protein [Candidatus Omnitrophota bacterium]
MSPLSLYQQSSDQTNSSIKLFKQELDNLKNTIDNSQTDPSNILTGQIPGIRQLVLAIKNSLTEQDKKEIKTKIEGIISKAKNYPNSEKFITDLQNIAKDLGINLEVSITKGQSHISNQSNINIYDPRNLSIIPAPYFSFNNQNLVVSFELGNDLAMNQTSGIAQSLYDPITKFLATTLAFKKRMCDQNALISSIDELIEKNKNIESGNQLSESFINELTKLRDDLANSRNIDYTKDIEDLLSRAYFSNLNIEEKVEVFTPLINIKAEFNNFLLPYNTLSITVKVSKGSSNLESSHNIENTYSFNHSNYYFGLSVSDSFKLGDLPLFLIPESQFNLFSIKEGRILFNPSITKLGLTVSNTPFTDALLPGLNWNIRILYNKDTDFSNTKITATTGSMLTNFNLSSKSYSPLYLDFNLGYKTDPFSSFFGDMSFGGGLKAGGTITTPFIFPYGLINLYPNTNFASTIGGGLYIDRKNTLLVTSTGLNINWIVPILFNANFQINLKDGQKNINLGVSITF